MTDDPARDPKFTQNVIAAVIAMGKAGRALADPAPLRRAANVSIRLPDGTFTSGGVSKATDTSATQAAEKPVSAPPTQEAIQAAQEAALEAFPEDVRVAARATFHARLSGKGPETVRTVTRPSRPSLIPTSLPLRRPQGEVPPFPPAGLDDPDVRDEWSMAHQNAAEARFQLQPQVLRAYAEAQLAWERWVATEKGRKPSGDLRHPVPRDRLEQITAEMRDRHERSIMRAEKTIGAIASGDVVGVEHIDMGGDEAAPILVLQSELDRKAAAQRARANRTPAEIEAAEAAWDEMVERMIAELPPPEPEREIPNLPDLPSDREPTAGELAAFSNAIRKHLAYEERGDQIEAKRKKDAATKARTNARRVAEQADPDGTAAGKQAVKLAKAADRQRRWRDRQRPPQKGEP